MGVNGKQTTFLDAIVLFDKKDISPAYGAKEHVKSLCNLNPCKV